MSKQIGCRAMRWPIPAGGRPATPERTSIRSPGTGVREGRGQAACKDLPRNGAPEPAAASGARGSRRDGARPGHRRRPPPPGGRWTARSTRIWCVRPRCPARNPAAATAADTPRASRTITRSRARASSPPPRSPSASRSAGSRASGASIRLHQVGADRCPQAQRAAYRRIDTPLGHRLAELREAPAPSSPPPAAPTCPCRGGARSRPAPRRAPLGELQARAASAVHEGASQCLGAGNQAGGCPPPSQVVVLCTRR